MLPHLAGYSGGYFSDRRKNNFAFIRIHAESISQSHVNNREQHDFKHHHANGILGDCVGKEQSHNTHTNRNERHLQNLLPEFRYVYFLFTVIIDIHYQPLSEHKSAGNGDGTSQSTEFFRQNNLEY